MNSALKHTLVAMATAALGFSVGCGGGSEEREAGGWNRGVHRSGAGRLFRKGRSRGSESHGLGGLMVPIGTNRWSVTVP